MKNTIAQSGTAFSLPMMAVFSVVNHHDRSVAHALDFDLVAVAPTEDEAVRKLRLAVKRHVEYGLNNHFDLDILQKAPDKNWSAITVDSGFRLTDPIDICHKPMLTGIKTITEHEDQRSFATA